MERSVTFLNAAYIKLKAAEQMTYFTFDIARDNRLLIKILHEIYASALNIMNAALQYEQEAGHIYLSEDADRNLQLFRNKCAARFRITAEELTVLDEIRLLMGKHKESPFEFVRKEQFVIVSNTFETETITLPQITGYLVSVQRIMRKISSILLSKH